MAATFAAVLLPAPAFAHDAFGDLGPFYAGLLHPLADPAQGLLLIALGVLLAVQPLTTVRPAYAVAVFTGAAAGLIDAAVGLEAPSLRAFALAAMILGLSALVPLRMPPWLGAGIAGLAAAAAGLVVDLPAGPRSGIAALGSLLGLALAVLLVWGAVDSACRRFGTIAGSVAGSWVAAIGLMAAVLPA